MSLIQISSSLLLLIATPKPVHCVQYVALDEAPGTPGGTRFDNEIGTPYTEQTLQLASQFIWNTFQQGEADRKDVEQVTMSMDIDAQGFVAYMDPVKNEIHVSSSYIASYVGDVRIELIGVLYHESTHVWQWQTNGQALSGFIEGIADYVRLSSGWAPSGWVQRGTGTRWDEGYAITAYFLEYCSSFRNGFVGELNGMMKSSYSDDYFVQLLGKSVDQLWDDYKAQYNTRT